MTFGMPRALFPVLSLSVYHAGAAGAGLLYAAVAAGSTIAALTTGWLLTARYLGRIVLVAVAAWGAFVALAGLVDTLWPVAALTSPAFSVVSGGLVCLASVGLIAAAFPQLAAYDGAVVGAGELAGPAPELVARVELDVP